MTLEALLDVAAEGWYDPYIFRQYYTDKTDDDRDPLAEFIVDELEQTLDRSADDDEQLEVAVRVVDNILRDVQNVRNALAGKLYDIENA